MKKLFILLVTAGALYGVYRYTLGKHPLTVTDGIVIARASGLDIHAGISPPPMIATVEGVVTNTTDRDVYNVVLVYTVGYDTVKAVLGYLTAGTSSNFKTTSLGVRSSHPGYTLEDISFDERE